MNLSNYYWISSIRKVLHNSATNSYLLLHDNNYLGVEVQKEDDEDFAILNRPIEIGCQSDVN